MPRTWGNWSDRSASQARYRVGMDWSRSGTRVTVSQYVFESEYSIYKDVTLRRTGSLSGTYSEYVGTSGGVVSLGRGGSATGSRGGSVTLGGRVTNILHGLTCSVSLTVNIPALPPAAPPRLRITGKGATWVECAWNRPASNGAAIDYYRVSRNGDFFIVNDRDAYFTNLTPNSSNFVNVQAHNSAGYGPWAGREYFTTNVARPAAPSNFTATRINDGRVELSWSRNSTSQAPYDRIIIRRQVNDGSWYTHATLSGSATGYTNTTVSYGNSYHYNVRAENDAGQSGYVNPIGGRVYMRPWSPPTPDARKLSGGNIRVSWDASSSGYVDGYVIYDSPDGGSWVQVGTTTSRSWTHIDPDPTVTHTYSVASTYASLEGNRSLSSNTVQLQAPPLAPTLISPEDGVVLPRTDAVELVWRHESVDTTDQTEYEVAYRVDGGEVTVYSGTAAQSHTISASDLSGTITWNVRTRGADPNWGPWSPANTFLLASVPSVVIQSPSTGTLTAAHVAVEWSYADDDGHAQATWQAELLDDEGQLLEQASGHGAATLSHAFEARLSDAVEYTIRVRARSGAGLWSVWDETYFTTDFPLPATIEPGLEWDRDTASVSVTLATEPLADTTYAWTGTPGESTSTETVDGVVVRENLSTNPSAEYGITRSWAGAGSVTVDPARGRVGPSSFLLDHAAGNIYRTEVGAATSGTTYTYSAWIWAPVGETHQVRVTGSGFDAVSGDEYAGIGDWQRVSLTATASADGAMSIYPATGATGQVWVDGIFIEESAAVGEYFDGDTEDSVAPDVVDVERRDAGGQWVMLASELDPYTSIVDPTPRLTSVEYRIISRTVLPSESVGPVAMIDWDRRQSDPSVFVTGGEGMSMVCTAQGGQASDEHSIEQAAIRFAGQRYATGVFGVGSEQSVSFTGKIVHTATDQPVSTRDEWVDLLQQFGTVCYRDTVGRKVFGLLTVDFSLDRVIEQVNLGVQRTRYLEGVQ